MDVQKNDATQYVAIDDGVNAFQKKLESICNEIDTTGTPTKEASIANDDKSSVDYKIDKFKALYQCRAILAKHGTMQERQICGRQLDRMRKLGIRSV